VLRLRWIVFAAIVILFVTIMGTAYILEWRQVDRLSSTLDERMELLVAKTRSLQDLRERISFYSTAEGVAHLARDQYNLVMPGEIIYRIVVTSKDVLPKK
jgi:cell division protein FtsB